MATTGASGPTYSVSFRLLRTTTEVAFVSVSVTADLIVEQPDGTGRIDSAKMVQRALELGQSPDVVWYPQDQQVQPHPIQKPPPGI
jgi:hypothetical protein